MSDEKKISERYRELPREEPPRALDDAILAASRRAVRAHPAPLVVPSGRGRWYFPLAAAAVIVLAVAVTVHVDRERPDAELMSGPVAVKEEVARQQEAPKPAEVARTERAPAKPAAPAAPAPARQAAPPVFAPDPKSEAAAPPAREARAKRDAGPASAAEPALGAASPPRSENALDSARAKAVAEAERRQAATAAQGTRRADEAPRKSAAVLAKVTAEQSPEQLLQGIADLRRQGRHEEADKALAEFRKRYPDYKISEAMLEKVEKRR